MQASHWRAKSSPVTGVCPSSRWAIAVATSSLSSSESSERVQIRRWRIIVAAGVFARASAAHSVRSIRRFVSGRAQVPIRTRLPEAGRGREGGLLDRHPAEEIARGVDALELEDVEQLDQVAGEVGGREGMARILALTDAAVVVDQDGATLGKRRDLERQPAGAATADAHHQDDRRHVGLRSPGRGGARSRESGARASRGAWGECNGSLGSRARTSCCSSLCRGTSRGRRGTRDANGSPLRRIARLIESIRLRQSAWSWRALAPLYFASRAPRRPLAWELRGQAAERSPTLRRNLSGSESTGHSVGAVESRRGSLWRCAKPRQNRFCRASPNSSSH